MPINTQQLHKALQTAAANLQTGWNDRTGEAKVEHLSLKNVYIGSDQKLHVSNHGATRMWAQLRGRPTGEAALRAGMQQAGIPAGVIHRAMQGITAFQQKHAGWEATRDTEIHLATLGVEANVTAGPEPSRDLESIVRQADTEEVQTAKAKAALLSILSPTEAGKREGEAIVRSCSQSDDPLGQLDSRLKRLQDQQETATKAAAMPAYTFKANPHQAEAMRTLNPLQEIERLQATIGVVNQELSRLRPAAGAAAAAPAAPQQRLDPAKGAVNHMMAIIAATRLDDFTSAARINEGKSSFLTYRDETIEKHAVMKNVAQRFGEHFNGLDKPERAKFLMNADAVVQMAIGFAKDYHAQNPVE